MVDVTKDKRKRLVFFGIDGMGLAGRRGLRKRIFSKRLFEPQCGFADRATFHFGDKIEDTPADAARTGDDARSRLTGPGIPNETDREAVITPRRRVSRKRAFSAELVRADSPKMNIIVGEYRFHRNLAFEVFEIDPVWSHRFATGPRFHLNEFTCRHPSCTQRSSRTGRTAGRIR